MRNMCRSIIDRILLLALVCSASAFKPDTAGALLGGPRLLASKERHHQHARQFVLQVSRAGAVHDDSNHPQRQHTAMERVSQVKSFADKNFFLLGMFAAVGFARAFPALGANGGVLRPELFIGQHGVTLIFLLSGLSLELNQLKEAASNVKLNFLTQLMSFFAWPYLVGLPLVTAISRFAPSLLPKPLLDGILIPTCLPTTVNMCVILTSSAGGNVASALCNAVFSNLAGIFITPALLLQFLGADIHLPFFSMLFKLSNKVLLPVAIGQALRATKAKDFYASHSKIFKRLQEVILLGILWNAFCTAISENLGLEFRHGLILLGLLPTVHLVSLGLLFAFFSMPFLKFSRGEVVSAMFCASQKTLAFGFPLVNTIFQGSSNLAAYCAPIMFIHPIQLILGSLLLPRLEKFTANEDSQRA